MDHFAAGGESSRPDGERCGADDRELSPQSTLVMQDRLVENCHEWRLPVDEQEDVGDHENRYHRPSASPTLVTGVGPVLTIATLIRFTPKNSLATQVAFKNETDFQSDLYLGDFAAGDLPPHFNEFEPLQVPNGFRRAFDGGPNGVIDAFLRSPDEIYGLEYALVHRQLFLAVEFDVGGAAL